MCYLLKKKSWGFNPAQSLKNIKEGINLINNTYKNKMQTKNKKRNNEEFKLQCQCIDWFRLQYPKELMFAIPNGGRRNLIEAVNLKRMGVLAGVPDLFLAKSNNTYNGMFIEMKASKGKESEAQQNISSILQAKGYAYVVCKDFQEFCIAIKFYLYQPNVFVV